MIAPNAAELPARGDIWLVDLEATRGREQRGTRPALVVSTDRFTRGPAELAIVLPVKKVAKGIPSHVPIARAESGLDHDSLRFASRCGALRGST